MFERHFVAYGVRIRLRVDSRGLLDALEQDPAFMHLPFGWRGEARSQVAWAREYVGVPMSSAVSQSGAI